MQDDRTTLRIGDLIPAYFIGAPVGFLGLGLLMQVMTPGWALAVGAIVGIAVGLSVIAAIRSK